MVGGSLCQSQNRCRCTSQNPSSDMAAETQIISLYFCYHCAVLTKVTKSTESYIITEILQSILFEKNGGFFTGYMSL